MEAIKGMLDIPHIRSKYRDRMLHVCFTVSGWSPEPEGQRHGCVLAKGGKYILATGFNGPDRDWQKRTLTDCGGSCCHAPVVHAEVNALLNLGMVGVRCDDMVAYVTKKPCTDCQRALADAGVLAVFWMQDVGEDRGQWVRP